MSSPLVAIAPAPRKQKKPWYRSPKVLRHGVMAFFFLFLLHVAYDHQVKGGGPRGTPSVEAYCPFGGLETLYQFLTTGGFIRRIELSAVVLFGALVVLTLIGSRGFCGWVCPFGSLQEWIGLAGRKLFGKRFNPTGTWDRALRYFKYVVLAAVITLTWHLGTLVFRDYDPFLAFFHLGQGIDELPWAYAALGVALAGSLYIERFFCKYACPLGAVLGLLGRAGLVRVRREPSNCKGCNLCSRKCHAHVDFLAAESVKDPDCNLCMDCVVDCPKPNILEARGFRRRFSHPVYAALLVGGLFAFIGVSQLAGKWQTKPEAVSFTDGAGRPDPDNIRGWMTLGEIAAGYGVPPERLYREAGIPARVPASARLNTVAREYHVEFEAERVREVVRAFVAGKPSPAAPGAHKKPAETGEAEVKGFMALNEIALKTGVPKQHLMDALQLPADIDARVPVREWMHDRGKSIQDLRDAVESYRAARR